MRYLNVTTETGDKRTRTYLPPDEEVDGAVHARCDVALGVGVTDVKTMFPKQWCFVAVEVADGLLYGRRHPAVGEHVTVVKRKQDCHVDLQRQRRTSVCHHHDHHHQQ